MKVLKFKEYSKINEELSKSSILAGLMSLIFGYSSAQKQIDINFNQQTILKNSIKLDSNSIQKLFNTIKKAYPKISVDTIKMTNPSEIEISSVLNFIKQNFLIIKIDINQKNNEYEEYLKQNGVNDSLVYKNNNTQSNSIYFHSINIRNENKFTNKGENIIFSNPIKISKTQISNFSIPEFDIKLRNFTISIDASDQLWSMLFSGAFDLDGISNINKISTPSILQNFPSRSLESEFLH